MNVVRRIRGRIRKEVGVVSVLIGTPVRARIYRGLGIGTLRVLPTGRDNGWRLEPPPKGSRKIEIGSGRRPQQGYVHVDADPRSPHLEFKAQGHALPFPDHWADEILSIHMLEHVPPPLLQPTLREWRRVLRAGGLLRIHTPNGATLARALTETRMDTANAFWAVQSAIFGYGCHPRECNGPGSFRQRGDHRVLFVFTALRDMLEQAGFTDVEDVSGGDRCHHAVEWAPYVPGLCLEIRAVSRQ